MTVPALRRTGARTDVRAVVLLLHGGQEEGTQPVLRRNASWWRMALVQSALRRWARREGLALWLLQYRVRGWNAGAHPEPDPVRDARWALARSSEAYPGLPVVVVGHSMGGRTACRVADDPAVVGVCALAPWLPEAEPVEPVAGRTLRVVHGTRDKWTSARWSRVYVERAERVAVSASWRALEGVGHFMFRKVPEWHAFVRDSVDTALDAADAVGRER